MVSIHPSRKKTLSSERDQLYFQAIKNSIKDKSQSGEVIYPPASLIFNAFDQTPFNEVKVVILGQDPYHGPGQAHGLSFSVPDGVRQPPSLQNIYKEIINEYGGEAPSSGNLTHWAKQGVLLLNAFLTVTASQPGSHQGIGWEQFTDRVIQVISDKKEHVVFMLRGKFAQSKSVLIDSEKHCVLESPHPSPFSAHRGFFGNNHFKTANEYLAFHKKQGIQWIEGITANS